MSRNVMVAGASATTARYSRTACSDPLGRARRSVLLVSLFALAPAAEVCGELRIYPERIVLEGAADRQSFLVQHAELGGFTADVTDEAEIRFEKQAVAKLTGNVLTPLQDGIARLTVQWQGESATAEVVVRDALTEPTVSFRNDVLPALMRGGCNAGRCHGAARGKDGFRLSLFGFDPPGDHFRLTRELAGRRLNLALPEESLLLRKALGEVPHTGGERFDAQSAHYRTLRDWIAQGALDDPDSPQPIALQVYPPTMVLSGGDASQRLVVIARYSDGSDRDVTPLALYLSNNDYAAKVDEDGVVGGNQRGEALVMARFATFTEGVAVRTFPTGEGPRAVSAPTYNFIDQLVHSRLAELGLEPSETCTDEEFLRRATIDLTGLLPTPEAHAAFVADAGSGKREALVESLLQSEAFVDLWAMKFGELLKIRTTNQVSYKALLGMHNWVRGRLATGAPLDALVRDVLTASGSTFQQPPANFYQLEANPLLLAENVAQSFLGVRLQCAQCHNHPFDRWTMDDYYGFAAFFSQVGFKQARDPRELIVFDRTAGETLHPVDNRVVRPKFLGGARPDLTQQSRRVALADWLASADNPLFAEHLANVVWAQHFGRGLVEPVDDVRVSNPPTHPELSRALGQRLAENAFDLRSLVREICLSRTYQLATRPNAANAADESYFSRAQVRRIRAETLLDSISQITRTQDRFARMPIGARAVQLPDGAAGNYFLTTFGRAPRETVCSCEVDVEPNLSQAFHLLNGETTNAKVAEGGLIPTLLEEGLAPSEVIERLYVLCYARKPLPAEQAQLVQSLDPDDIASSLEDILWALLNSKEFLFNH